MANITHPRLLPSAPDELQPSVRQTISERGDDNSVQIQRHSAPPLQQETDPSAPHQLETNSDDNFGISPASSPPERNLHPIVGTNRNNAVSAGPVSSVTQPQFIRRSPRKLSGSTSSAPQTANNQGAPSRASSQFDNCFFSERDTAVRFYSYLSDRTVKQLQLVSRQWSLKISNRSKKELIARCMLHVFFSGSTGISFDELLRKNRACNDYNVWVEKAISNCRTWEILPAVNSFLQQVHPAEKPTVAKSIMKIIDPRTAAQARNRSRNSNFTINEFARLLVLLRDDSRFRHALFKACGGALTREESDARVSREAFWGVIARRCNDEKVHSCEDFTGHLEEVDSNCRPPVPREASSLKEHFYNAKRAFTVVYDRWSASGQNDPKRITAFLQLCNTGDYTTDAKRTLIIFLVCRVGTPQEDTQLLQMASKLISNEGGGLDEGINESIEAGVSETRQRKRKSAEITSGLEDVSRSLSNFTGYVKEQIEQQKRKKTPALREVVKYAQEAEEEGLIIAQLLTSAKRVREASELGDETISKMIQTNLKRNMKRYKKYCKETSKGDSDADSDVEEN